MKAIIFATCFLLVVSNPTWSDNSTQLFQTGNTLLAKCTTDISAQNEDCYSYIKGTVDTGLFFWDLTSWGACFPSGVTAGQLSQVFVKYAEENPELLHGRASDLVLASVSTAFPCSEDD